MLGGSNVVRSHLSPRILEPFHHGSLTQGSNAALAVSGIREDLFLEFPAVQVAVTYSATAYGGEKAGQIVTHLLKPDTWAPPRIRRAKGIAAPALCPRS